MPRAIAKLAEDYLDNPIKVMVAPVTTTAERIDQGVVFVSSERKWDLLVTMLRDPAFGRVLVFTRTKHGADRVVRQLMATGIEASAIHGNKSQPQPERALAGFRDGEARVLVATDIPRHRRGWRIACHQFRAAECARRVCASYRQNGQGRSARHRYRTLQG